MPLIPDRLQESRCKHGTKKNFTKILKWIGKVILTAGAIIIISLLFLSMIGTVAHAAGLVDDTVNTANEYSKYPLSNYQLDFYVDNSWDWLPWNWIDGIGKQVMYGLYAITNFIWIISLYISNATGYLVKEAYSLDFISSTANAIGKNMQTLAGVTSSGLSSEGFYVGFLLIFILILGIYVTYMGLIKKETTKAVHAIVNFVLYLSCPLHSLPMLRIILQKSMTFHRTSAMLVCHWVRKSPCRIPKQREKTVWI